MALELSSSGPYELYERPYYIWKAVGRTADGRTFTFMGTGGVPLEALDEQDAQELMQNAWDRALEKALARSTG